MINGKKTISDGFTLIEVLMAMFIFAMFMAGLVTSLGYSLNTSSRMKDDLKLRRLCEDKINELIVNPPVFSERLTLTNESTTFPDEENYEYELEYGQLFIPALHLLEGNEEEETTGLDEQLRQKTVELMKNLVWQVLVTVRNKTTGHSYSASTWLFNNKAPIDVSSF